MYKKPLPTAERLRYLLSYDPDTGELRWKNPTSHRCSKGPICPGAGSAGYKHVTVDKVTYLQHRIIWTMQTGAPPPDELVVDHIDEDPSNNRWSNLRLVTLSHNVSRSSKHTHDPVTLQLSPTAWKVWVGRHYVGTFATEAEAREADPRKTVDRRFNATPVVRARRAKSKSGWEARVSVNGKRVHLGTFPTKEQALDALAHLPPR